MSRRRVSQGTLFELHVGMQVNLRRFGGFVTEPESDDAEVHAALEQGHRSRSVCGLTCFAASEGQARRAVPTCRETSR